MHSARVFVLGLFLSIPHVRGDLPCPLVWQPNGFGHYDNASYPVHVHDTNGGGRLVARVSLDGADWVAGILDPRKGKIFSAVPFEVDGGGAAPQLEWQVRAFDFYQVLTNPHGCILRWTATTSNQRTPPLAFPVDNMGTEFVARALVQGHTVGGRVHRQQLLTPLEDAIHKPPMFQVLVSVYPKLQVLIRKLSYPTLDLVAIRAATATQLVEGELIVNAVNDLQLTTTVRHSKTTDEQIVLQETVEFAEVGRLSLWNVGLWFRGHDLQLDNYSTGGSAVVIDRRRAIEAIRTITVARNTDVQLCTTMDILEDFPVDFVAVAEFRLEGMSPAHVEHVLNEVGGRPVVSFHEDYVLATMTGTLSGRYVTSTTMQNSAPDKLGPCASFL